MVQPLRTRHQRSLAATSGLVLAVVALAATSGTAVSAPSGTTATSTSAAAPAPYMRYASGSVTVKSSTGKKLNVTATVSAYSDGAAGLSVRLANGGEDHSWSFVIPASSVKISNKGVGSIKVPAKKLGGFGVVKLTIKSAGKLKPSKCGGKVYMKSRTTKLAGTFFFNSKSKWGKVGSKKKKFAFKSPRTHLYYDVECPPGPNTTLPCQTGVNWSGYRTTPKSQVTIHGTRNGKVSTIRGSRSTQLAKPKGAHRYDSVTKKVAAPKLTERADMSAKITMKGTKGSGSANSTDPGFDHTGTCSTGTQHRRYWYAALANGKPPLQVKAQVFGDFKLPNKTDISFTKLWRTA